MRNNRKDNIGFNDIWFRVIGIPIIGIFVPPVFFNKSFTNEIYWLAFIISTVYAGTYWHLCRYVFIVANQKFSSLRQNNKRLRFILLYCGLIILLLCPLVHEIIEPLLGIDDVFLNLRPTMFQIYAANITMHLAIASIYESIRNFSLWEQSETEKERLETEQISSQLEGLKSQVNPHFLFNSLNTLISIIPEDSERSVRFVRQLSKIYRYFLNRYALLSKDKIVVEKTETEFCVTLPLL